MNHQESLPEPTELVSKRVWTIPNLISFFRIGLIPVFVHFILKGDFDWALGIFAVAGISDGLDGFLARRLNQRSQLGQILDPIGDKLLMLCSFIVLAVPGGLYTPIPLWLAVCVIGRDVGIVLAAALIYRRTGFRDFKPAFPGKLSTVVQVCFVVFVLLANVWPAALWLLPAASGLTGATTAFSAIYYGFYIRVQLRAFREQTPAICYEQRVVALDAPNLIPTEPSEKKATVPTLTSH
ncbi:MAG: CDP-alcohol phosphatidyltransferase family protein [Blastocatellia bacterium]|nr:CDP-alcohol phosphatidyltransferase family protein [Blastocatellia bacterium]